MSEFKYVFRPDMPPSGPYGVGQEVRLRATDELLGYVRSFDVPWRNHRYWMSYTPDGSERAECDLKQTAANGLKHDAMRERA